MKQTKFEFGRSVPYGKHLIMAFNLMRLYKREDARDYKLMLLKTQHSNELMLARCRADHGNLGAKAQR